MTDPIQFVFAGAFACGFLTCRLVTLIVESLTRPASTEGPKEMQPDDLPIARPLPKDEWWLRGEKPFGDAG